MEINYWKSRWKDDKTGWQMDEVYPLLKKYWPQLNLAEGATVLVPLCGKSLDLEWLAKEGCHVIGVEVSDLALQEVMKRTKESFTKNSKGSFEHHHAATIDLWCGDIFKLKKKWLPPIDAVYDKAALIALPPEERRRYAAKIQSLIKSDTQILLNCFEYNQDEMKGPPFAVFREEVESLWGDDYSIKLLHKHSLFEVLTNFRRRGLQSYLDEKLYILQPS